MKRFFNVKALVFSLVMVVLGALPVNAQQGIDNYFKVDDGYVNRDPVFEWTITNNGIGQSEAPIGSGLLILTAVGAGYAVARRKRNLKKGTTLLLAFALLLGMTQCKKNVETLSHVGINTAHITLKVDDGSKVIVNPTGGDGYATVTYEDGDIIYVGYNNQYVGTLTYKVIDEETKYFEGDITIGAQVDDQPLHFYFLGGKGFTPTINENTATVNISDQTSKYPVISYNHSNEVYTVAGEYTATLFNYCSIMKFTTDNVTDINSQVLCITGMNNKVTVDFTKAASELESDNHGFSFGVDGTDGGLIQMPTSTDGTRWAIVLPQDALDAGVNGSAYINGGIYHGARPAMDAIVRNTYLNTGVSLTLTQALFSISDTEKVLFSPGNLVKTDDAYTVGSGSETYAFETTPFNINGGSLGYNQGTPTSISARGYFTWNEIISDGVTSESPRLFTVNGVANWRSMTYDECDYLLWIRDMNEGVKNFYRIDLGSDQTHIGFLIPPDEATSDDVEGLYGGTGASSGFTQNVNVDTYISRGFIFLPAVGLYIAGSENKWMRNCTIIDEEIYYGYYWLTTEEDDDGAYWLYFHASGQSNDDYDEKYYYCSVRLVRSVE